jgi:hypothetical protein
MTLSPTLREELLGQVDSCQFDCMATIAEQMAELPPSPVRQALAPA